MFCSCCPSVMIVGHAATNSCSLFVCFSILINARVHYQLVIVQNMLRKHHRTVFIIWPGAAVSSNRTAVNIFIQLNLFFVFSLFTSGILS